MEICTRLGTPGLAIVALVAACRFDPPPSLGDGGADDDGDAFDAAELDAPEAPPECTPSTTVCRDGWYVECSAQGTPARTMRCPLGCADDDPRCIDVDPSNGLAAQLDLTANAPAISFAGSSTIDTKTGIVFNGAVSIDVPNELVNGMRVLRFSTLDIQGTLKVSGDAALVLLADRDVTIGGLLDVSGAAGGAGRSTETSCRGESASGGPGGGGGGRAGNGAHGGSSGGTPGGAGGTSLSDPDLVPLQGGCAGGAGGSGTVGIAGAAGGTGGGAVQIVSRARIAITGSGRIDASGKGGGSGWVSIIVGGTVSGSGGGGGSGGGVLLEAPQIVLDGAGVVVSTKGGGGGGAVPSGVSVPGANGGTDAAPAAGGYYSGHPRGGNGGIVGTAPTVGGDGTGTGTTARGAGGGGRHGQARFNTETGGINPQNGAAIRSAQTTGTLATRLVPAGP